jgi:hypothetical protein
MPGDPQQCRDQAARCRELAARATNVLARQTYLSVADKWDALAEEIIQAKLVLTAINMVGGDNSSDASTERPEIT